MARKAYSSVDDVVDDAARCKGPKWSDTGASREMLDEAGRKWVDPTGSGDYTKFKTDLGNIGYENKSLGRRYRPPEPKPYDDSDSLWANFESGRKYKNNWHIPLWE